MLKADERHQCLRFSEKLPTERYLRHDLLSSPDIWPSSGNPLLYLHRDPVYGYPEAADSLPD